MAKGAPKGNEFWKLRSRHGRKTLFATPELLWEAACEYFTWCEKNPLIAIEFVGKEAIRVEIPKMRAFTMMGLCQYLDCHTAYFREFKEGLKTKKGKKAKEFSSVVTRIEETVYTQKFTGAAAGFLNANIIARDLGLSDKKEIENKTIIVETPEEDE